LKRLDPTIDSAELGLATTAIEGNTLSEAEVLAAVEDRLDVPPSKGYLLQEVQNIIAACTEIVREAAQGDSRPLTPALLLDLNRRVLAGLPPGEEVRPGELRLHSVLVGKVYRGAPAEDLPYLVDTLCTWLGGEDFAPRPGLEMVYAVIQAVVSHVYLAWIHPFGDGNGRTARLLEFALLLRAGVPSPAAHLLSNHYNQTRAEYYRQLEAASRSGGDLLPFLGYAVRGFVDGLRSQLEYVWEQQWDVIWQNLVHEAFDEARGKTGARQRALALALGVHGDWVQASAVDELDPRLARDYAGVTSKTLQRDLAALERLGLVVRAQGRVRAKREVIFAFLPLRSRRP